jgi:spore maturation protein SpmB
LIPSLLATFCSTVAGVLVAKALARRRAYAAERYVEAASEPEAGPTLADAVAGLDQAQEEVRPRPPASRLRLAGVALFGALMVWALARYLIGAPEGAELAETGREILKSWLLPLLMAAIALFGFSHRVKVYESFIQGAREGFQIAVMIIPFLVAILVAVGMFRASGALEAIIAVVNPATSLVGFPADALPMALIRPLSGSGAMGVMTETMRIHGPDSFVGYLVSVMNGSTETTFYVLALYFGSVRVRAARHTVAACLSADAVGIAAALFWCRLFF